MKKKAFFFFFFYESPRSRNFPPPFLPFLPAKSNSFLIETIQDCKVVQEKEFLRKLVERKSGHAGRRERPVTSRVKFRIPVPHSFHSSSFLLVALHGNIQGSAEIRDRWTNLTNCRFEKLLFNGEGREGGVLHLEQTKSLLLLLLYHPSVIGGSRCIDNRFKKQQKKRWND